MLSMKTSEHWCTLPRCHMHRDPEKFYNLRGPVRGGRFPAFRGNISIFLAFRSFFSNFPVSMTSHCLFGLFRFSTTFEKSFPLSTNIFKFSGFPWLENGFFRFSAGYFGLFRFSATFLGLFRLSAIYLTPPHLRHDIKTTWHGERLSDTDSLNCLLILTKRFFFQGAVKDIGQ